MTAVETARSLLPWWVKGAAPAAYLLSALVFSSALSLVLAYLAYRPFRQYSGELWVERARLAFPVRMATRFHLVLFPVLFGALAFSWGLPPVTGLGKTAWAWMVAFASLVGPLGVWWRFSRLLRPDPPPFRYRLQGALSLTLLMLSRFLIALAVMAVLPPAFNLRALAVYLAALLALAWLSWTGGLGLLARLGLARPASARLAELVRTLSDRLHRPPPPVFEIVCPLTNAWAFIPAGKLAFTDACLALLDGPELEAIAAHELAHLTEPRRFSLLRFAQNPALLAMVSFPLLIPTLGLLPYLAILLASLGALILIARQLRRMEARADEQARAAEPAAGTYAQALEKLYRANLIPAVMAGKNAIHPHLYDRLLAAGVQPAYPRPEPPAVRRTLLWSLVAIMVLMVFASFPALYLRRFTQSLAARSEPGLLLSLGFSESGWQYQLLADRSRSQGDDPATEAFYRAAEELEGRGGYVSVDLIGYLAEKGRCLEAREILEEIQSDSEPTPGESAEDH